MVTNILVLAHVLAVLSVPLMFSIGVRQCYKLMGIDYIKEG